MKPVDDSLYDLVEAVIQDLASEEQQQQLEKRLRNNPDARLQYVRYLNLHSELHRRFRGGKHPPSTTVVEIPTPPVSARIGWLVTLTFLISPMLLVGSAAYCFSDRSLALPGWSESVELWSYRFASVVTSLLAMSWFGGLTHGLLVHPRVCGVGGVISVLVGTLSSQIVVSTYSDHEMIRREEMVQNHLWVSYDSVFYWPENQIENTNRASQEPTSDQIRRELKALREAGFDGLYIHECRAGQVKVPRIAKEVGFTAIIQGVRIGDPDGFDDDSTQQQIRNAISVREFVDAYCLGELSAREVNLVALKDELARIRWQTGKPVTTSFLHRDYIGARGKQLRELEDLTVRALARPWKGNHGDPEVAVAAVREALESFREDATPSLLSFVFYPSGGGDRFTPDDQYAFFAGVLSLEIPRGVGLIYFSSFDRPWAKKLTETTEYTPAFEAYTGLFAVEMSDDETTVKFVPKKALQLFKNAETEN